MPKQSNMEGKFSEFLSASRAAEKPEDIDNSTPISTDKSKYGSTEARKQMELKTVTFKAPEEVRTHWVVEARKMRTTVSELCRDALVERLGLPEGWEEGDL